MSGGGSEYDPNQVLGRSNGLPVEARGMFKWGRIGASRPGVGNGSHTSGFSTPKVRKGVELEPFWSPKVRKGLPLESFFKIPPLISILSET